MRWLPAVIWMTLIFSMSQQKGEGSGRLSRLIVETLANHGINLKAIFGESAIIFIRKTAHVTEYFILFQFIFLGLGKGFPWPKRGYFALFLTFLFAASDEFHQIFIPGRTGLVQDVLIDTFGALLGLGVSWVFWNWGNKR